MDLHKLKSSHCRRRQRSLTDSRKVRDERYFNLTKDLSIDRPFQVLSSDISYIRTGEGFDYLCQIRDVYSNTVLASLQHERMTKELVIWTMQAVKQRWHIPEGAIFHADRGANIRPKKYNNVPNDTVGNRASPEWENQETMLGARVSSLF